MGNEESAISSTEKPAIYHSILTRKPLLFPSSLKLDLGGVIKRNPEEPTVNGITCSFAYPQKFIEKAPSFSVP